MGFVRVRLENGMEATVSEAYAQSTGLQIVDGSAVDVRGRPLPAAGTSGPAPAPTPLPPLGADVDVWSGNGPPNPPPAGADPGDIYIDLVSGDVFKLDP